MTTANGAIGNALAQYCAAVDAHDAETVSRLLADAEVVFRDVRLTGRALIAAHYARAFAAGGPTRHTITDIQVDTDSGTARYRAAYQRWSLAAETPRREALGSYTGAFTAAHDEWIWTEHRITTSTLPAAQEPDDDH